MTISQSHTKGPFAIIVIITRWPVSLQLCMPVYCKCVCWLLWFAAVTHMNEFISWCLLQWLINFVYWLQCSVHRLSDLANWFPTQWLNKNCWLLNVSCVFCVESDCTPGCPIWQVDLYSISSNFTSDLIVKKCDCLRPYAGVIHVTSVRHVTHSEGFFFIQRSCNWNFLRETVKKI